MGERGRLTWLLILLAATVAVLTLAIVPSRSSGKHSSSTVLGARVNHANNGISCGSIGHTPTRAEVVRFATKQNLSPQLTADLLACYGFSARDSN